MLVGIASAFLFGLVDAYWIAQLGTDELAAMGFVMPVIFAVMSVAMGLGVGVTGVVARASGRGDRPAAELAATHGIALALTSVLVVSTIGVFTIDPLFGALGASAPILELVRAYMTPWYLGVGLLVIPMSGNSAIRGVGDTKTPMKVMLGSGLVNLVLDPCLIFGLGPFPAFGLRGAAYATIASWSCALVIALFFLLRVFKLLRPSKLFGAGILTSWREILRVGLPAAATQVLGPVSAAVLTRFVAGHGEEAVAGFGLAGRFETIALVGMMALASASTAFSGQNVGAEAFGRVREALRFAGKAAFVWCGVAALLLALLGGPLMSAFAEPGAETVVDVGRLYFLVVPFSYAALGFAMISGSVFNGANRPGMAAVIIVVRLFVVGLPASFLGDQLFGLVGIFWGLTLGNLATGALAAWLIHRWLTREVARCSLPPEPSAV